MIVAVIPSQTSLAFDSVAEQYDDQFTRSVVGRAQRDAVWRKAAATFSAGQHILELNCGTGEDALFLARHGISVTALDASKQMVLQARRRRDLEAPYSAIRFELLPTEDLADLKDAPLFDGVFSNFSGLNCVPDLAAVVEQLSARFNPVRRCFSVSLLVSVYGKFSDISYAETSAKPFAAAVDTQPHASTTTPSMCNTQLFVTCAHSSHLLRYAPAPVSGSRSRRRISNPGRGNIRGSLPLFPGLTARSATFPSFALLAITC